MNTQKVEIVGNKKREIFDDVTGSSISTFR